AASSASRARRNIAGQTGATIRARGARATRRAASRPPVGRHQAAQHAIRTGDAGQTVAAVSRRCAGFSGLAAHVAEAVAARNAQGIEPADAGVAWSAAAIVARRGDGAGVVHEVADVAFGIAARGVAADTDEVAGTGLVAANVARARQARSGRPAAIAIGLA